MSVMTTYFEISPDLEYLHEIDDRSTARQYIRQLVLPTRPVAELTNEQTYLRDLIELAQPVVQANRAGSRIRSAKARSKLDRASHSLTAAVRDIAHEGYHFRERVKAHMTSVAQVHRCPTAAKEHTGALARMLRRYDSANDRILRHRNFLVHGPKGRVDEFADLRLAELAAIVLHSDLWLDQKNVFDEYQRDWSHLGRTLLLSMEETIALLQTENENAIAGKMLSFCD